MAKKTKDDRPKGDAHKCTHNDQLCRKYGCPDDPNWKGDGCR